MTVNFESVLILRTSKAMAHQSKAQPGRETRNQRETSQNPLPRNLIPLYQE